MIKSIQLAELEGYMACAGRHRKLYQIVLLEEAPLSPRQQKLAVYYVC
jgi:hypothetical protein